MKISYLATVAILYSFGCCTCFQCNTDEPGYIHVHVVAPSDEVLRYTIYGSTSQEPETFRQIAEKILQKEVNRCHTTELAVKTAVHEWKCEVQLLLPPYIRFCVKRGDSLDFEKVIEDTISNCNRKQDGCKSNRRWRLRLNHARQSTTGGELLTHLVWLLTIIYMLLYVYSITEKFGEV